MGKKKTIHDDASSIAASIITTIRSSKNGKSMDLKELRTTVLAASNSDGAGVDKSSKKIFKSAVKHLEEDGKVSLSADGIVKLSKSERAKNKSSDDEPKSEKKKKKKDKKRTRESKDNEDELDGEGTKNNDNSKKKKKGGEGSPGNNVEQNEASNEEDSKIDYDNGDNESQNDNNTDGSDVDPKDKNKPCKNNPQGVTRLFLGNLPFAVSEPTLSTHLRDCVTHIKWITDKLTGKFYGSAFCEVRNSKDAAMCLKEINGTLLMGRPVKINYAPVRSGEEGDWPPRSRVITGGKVANAGGSTRGQAGGVGIKALSVKPEGCSKLFIGNLSYDLDDDGIAKFFMGVEAELKSVRWLHHKDSGDFKGCGYVDFWNTDACEKAAALNGKNLLGRPIRIDWAE
eukprot:CAMPEP_0181107388 /NCGR_PEP_ID=MMETSP1071-20121207/17060_1 /TAXON_ID=35127 /ORGANISM="Thalassiosira sp., Strain NH16" /LENGTH=397 /DNA_ID=CAMNT_0023190901 /DNA_START=87 /DNA_END=1280 /DNA_ORIENTATION=+